jgi:hypothetical protein
VSAANTASYKELKSFFGSQGLFPGDSARLTRCRAANGHHQPLDARAQIPAACDQRSTAVPVFRFGFSRIEEQPSRFLEGDVSDV